MRSVVSRSGHWLSGRCALAAIALGAAAAPLRRPRTIAAVTPQGEVAQVRQVTVQVLRGGGAARRPAPARPVQRSRCAGRAPAGTGRWVDDRVWLYDFREPLPPGVRCTLKARPDWKPLAAAPLDRARPSSSFSTGGPAIVSIAAVGGAQIDEDQHFLLHAERRRRTRPRVRGQRLVRGRRHRRAHAACAWSSATARDALLKARRIDASAAARDAAASPASARCRPTPRCASSGARASPRRRTRRSRTTVEQRLRLHGAQGASRPSSAASARTRNAPCLPLRPMALRFSAPVAREAGGAGPARARPPARRSRRCSTRTTSADEVERRHASPRRCPRTRRSRIELPRDLKDNAGRAARQRRRRSR